MEKLVKLLGNYGLSMENISDSRLKYLKMENKFMLYIPIHVKKKKILKRQHVVAIDPGEKIPFTLYGLEDYAHIGTDMREKILKYEKKIRKFQKILSKKENRKGKKLKNKIN